MSNPTAASNTHIQSQIPAPAVKISRQMRAVVEILGADSALFELASPFINFMADEIDWDGLFGLHLSSGQRAALDWSFICWRDEVPAGSNPFDSVLNCDASLQRAIMRGLSVRWGIAK